ncbi:hypothetical protein GDO81_021584 [Engystomops pustulosus]|uniref:L1 transposable element RRM domain-containing protein n=1 Tax=Engystomops pustulosus TaxID=76066 RepID=A0AAV6YNL2_ENGPU|nr:hypothetical protein GDO81_021584 [Engystomops pustulosus]
MPTQIRELQRQMSASIDRADDLENRLRRNNVRVVGLPEKVEGSDPVSFFENWLKNMLPADTFSPFFTVERAHRVPFRPGPPGGNPRPFLARLLHFRDRDSILRAVRTKGEILYANSRVSFYPDFSASVRKQRAQFTEVRARLRDKGYKYSMMYPAKLRIVDGQKTRFFTCPTEALHWADAAPRAPAARPAPPE